MADTESSSSEPKATFVFLGTIKKVQAATMRSVPVDDRTAVVRVEQVIEAPANLAHVAGTDVTVRLAGRAKAAVGRQFMFHAVGWIFGDSIALRALKQETVTGAHSAVLARGGNPAEHRADRELQERVAEADLVVSGKVVTIKLPEGTAPMTRAARGSVPISSRPVSEHDPKWREAVVAVDDVHKGGHAAQSVTVVFPASTDVRWFKAPKFEVGQQGLFVLHKSQAEPAGRARERSAVAGKAKPAEDKGTPVYTALHPQDFQPYTQQQRVSNAIGAAPGAVGGKEK
jgi:hypothetical protein